MRHSLHTVALLAAVVLAVQVISPARAEIEGRYRIELMNGKYVEGDVKELADGSYEVKTKYGVVVTIKRNEVRELRSLEEAVTEGAPTPGGVKRAAYRRAITDAEIASILSGVTANPDAALSGAARDDMLAELPLNEESLADMKKQAGPEAKVLLKPHFVMVYTSTEDAAQKLASRVESIYRWKVQFMRMMNAAAQRPEHKLEIYYFGTNKEYLASGGSIEAGGHYSPDDNRSYFYDAMTHPAIAPYVELSKSKDMDWRERQRLRNRINRFCEAQNLEVIQHETGHHIDFNIGLFPRNGLKRKAGVPRWLIEGTTQMFEVPPSTAGASLGVLNHKRLDEVRSRFGKHPLNTQDLKRFIIDDTMWFQNPWGGMYYSYSLGWSVVYYLWKEHRAAYGKYCKAVYDREEDVEMTYGEKEKEFEDLFGRVDDKWAEKYYAFLDSLQLKRSLLPMGDTDQPAQGEQRQQSGGGRNRGRRG